MREANAKPKKRKRKGKKKLNRVSCVRCFLIHVEPLTPIFLCSTRPNILTKQPNSDSTFPIYLTVYEPFFPPLRWTIDNIHNLPIHTAIIHPQISWFPHSTEKMCINFRRKSEEKVDVDKAVSGVARDYSIVKGKFEFLKHFENSFVRCLFELLIEGIWNFQ